MASNIKVLAADANVSDRDLLCSYLARGGLHVVAAADGCDVLSKLNEHPDVDVMVLDHHMPGVHGSEMLERIKANRLLRDVPVIMQTTGEASEQLLRDVQEGIYYHLVKPYGEEALLNLIHAALQDAHNKKEMRDDVGKHRHALGLMERARFRFQSLEEAKNLAYFLAHCFPEPEMMVYGLVEILVNAVEHGNLGISCAEKTELLKTGGWLEEVERRLALPENAEKFAYLDFEWSLEKVTLLVKDQGDGFDWSKYLDVSPETVTTPNGRGIITSRMVSFDRVEYLGCGNEVRLVKYRNAL